jgi:carbamoylphosphate synthase large subunit
MSIGGNFKESVQKALGSLEIGLDGFDQNEELDTKDLKKKNTRLVHYW